MNSFTVLNGGIFSLIEDFGRFGLCDKGITNSGVMDEYAYIIANNLLQNKAGTNCIEITLGGLKLRANSDCIISITGADCGCTINSKKINNWKTYNLHVGDILEFGYSKEGMRAYLAVKGGFDIPKELRSNSTTVKEQIGGINGDKLKEGDMLSLKNNQFEDYNISLKKDYIPKYEKHLVLRVVLGYQDDFFDTKEIEKFFLQKYTISTQNNRMGYRLEGEQIKCQIDGIISEGISFGAIQIPKDGQPIILLKESQTIGGYPKIGSVLPIDCFKLLQLRAGDSINFEQINIEEAQEKMRLFNSL